MTAPKPVDVGKTGNLTRDPELRFSAAGKPWSTFGLAVTPYVPKGEPEQETVFYEIVAFGSLAEHVSECLSTGDRVIVVGRGELDRWTGKDGVERTTKKIVADGVGPDLRFATVQIQRTERTERRTPANTSTSAADEEPF